MKRVINLSSLSKETQAAIKRELNVSKKVIASQFFKTEEEIRTWLDSSISPNTSYTIDPKTLVVNAVGSIWIPKAIKHLPVQFGKLEGFFTAHYGSLETLEGCPTQVIEVPGNPNNGSFTLHNIPLTSLQYSPEEVYEFELNRTDVASLEGLTTHIIHSLNIENNESLTSLKGLKATPKYITLDSNKNLKSLKYIPQNFTGTLTLRGDSFEDLKYLPPKLTELDLPKNLREMYTDAEIRKICDVMYIEPKYKTSEDRVNAELLDGLIKSLTPRIKKVMNKENHENPYIDNEGDVGLVGFYIEDASERSTITKTSEGFKVVLYISCQLDNTVDDKYIDEYTQGVVDILNADTKYTNIKLKGSACEITYSGGFEE